MARPPPPLSKMSVRVHLTLIVTIVSTLIIAAPQSSSATEEPVRFSRLLNQQSDLLRFTSISNLGPASPVFDQQNFQNLYNTQDLQSQADIKAAATQAGFASQFLHRSVNDDEDEESRVITEPQPGQEYVQIHQQLKQQQQDDQQPRESESDSVESSITTINQKPSGRKPLALLRQSAGNKLNISPVFPGSSVRRNGNNQVTILSDSRSQDEIRDATTISPVSSFTGDDEYEGLTTENVRHEDDDLPVTTYPPTFTDNKSKKDRMVVNVVTSVPRIVFDNTTSTTEGTTLAAATTTPKPTSVPVQESTSRRSKGDDENLVVDEFHRNGQFPDFEDSPAHLHTAESSQPARVNVRPASSGKDYEYEYIYYYYDDEDDDNSTSKKAVSDSSKGAVPETVAASPEFSSEKIAVAKPQSNSIVETPVTAPRTPKVYTKPEPVLPQTQESQEELVQVTTVLPEILRTSRPGSVNRPVVLKQSNLNLLHASAETPLASTERHRIPTTTTTTSAPSTTEAPRPRIRMSKSRTEAPAVNQFTRPNEEVPESVDSAPRRPAYKDAPRRRNPSRRLPQQQQQQQEASTIEQQQPVAQAEEPRGAIPAGGRTRFPPRQSSQSATESVAQQQSVAPIQELASQQSLESAQAVQEVDPAVADRKAKDNFARQKSINDLYALTRLHQLAINTRVPNRVPPKVVGGFVNSAEQTTRYDDITGSSEATTLASLFPSAISAEAGVVPTEQVYQAPPSTTTTTTTTTTTEPSLTSNDRFAAGKARNRFRQRGNRLNAADGPSSTTETASRAPANPNRFAGRRRPFASTTAATTEGEVSNVETSSVASRPKQAISRNRFAGRTRPPTSTTEANEAAVVANEGEHTENQAEKAQPPRRRPNFQGRRRNQQLQASSTPQSSDNAEVAQTPAAAAAPRSNAEGERRRFNFGNAAGRTRPASGPRPLVRGRPTSTTEATETVSTPQNPEPIVSEHVSVSESEQSEKPSTQQAEEQAPVVSISSTTSSSVSTDTVVVHKKGSAGVLGRLRSRTKPVSTTTTVAPEVTVAERKPSRLSGILNRRKVTPGTSTTNPVKQEEVPEVPHSPENQELEELQRKGVVIQVSSTVTESEEIGEHPAEEENSSSSTTHASILNRVKSQRKPGSIYRKAPSHSSE